MVDSLTDNLVEILEWFCIGYWFRSRKTMTDGSSVNAQDVGASLDCWMFAFGVVVALFAVVVGVDQSGQICTDNEQEIISKYQSEIQGDRNELTMMHFVMT